MSEILSQDEIDAILSALNAPEPKTGQGKKVEESRKKIRVYDFKRPSKFSKEQIHTIQAIHENYARLLATYFSGHLRTVVQITVHSVEQLTYEEFINTLPNPTILAIYNVEPLQGNAVLEINPEIIFTIIDRLFGGLGQAPEAIRDLTDIERVVIEKVIARTLDIWREAWDNIVHMIPRLDLIETNPLFTQIVSPTEMVVLISFRTQFGNNEGLINFCIPYIVLEPIMSKLSAHYWFAGIAKEATQETMDCITQRIENASLEVSAVLGEASITVGELQELQKGDVITLDSIVSEPIKINVGSKLKFKGRPGTVGSKLAFQVSAIVKEGENGNE